MLARSKESTATKAPLLTKDDVDVDNVDGGYDYKAIVDLRFWERLTIYPFQTVYMPRNSQGEEWIPIFDTPQTGIDLMLSMWQRKQSFCALGADGLVGMQSVSWVKLLIFDAACPYMQRLFASFIPIYVGGRTVFLSRYSSDYMNINEALESIGFRLKIKTELYSNRNLGI